MSSPPSGGGGAYPVKQKCDRQSYCPYGNKKEDSGNSKKLTYGLEVLSGFIPPPVVHRRALSQEHEVVELVEHLRGRLQQRDDRASPRGPRPRPQRRDDVIRHSLYTKHASSF